MLALHHHVAAATCPPMLFDGPRSETSIRADMAASLGSSLFLFHSLDHNLSTILKQAGRPQSLQSAPLALPPPSPSRSHYYPESKMCNPLFWKKNRKSRPTLPISKPPPIDPRERNGKGNQPPYNAEYKLSIQCSDCISRRKQCTTTTDLMVNSVSLLAYRDPWAAYQVHPKKWILELDFCSVLASLGKGPVAASVLQSFVGDGYHKGRGDGASRVAQFGVEQLKSRLLKEGVKFRSNV